MKAVILAAGYGTRMRPHTHTGPKHILPIANKPVLEYTLEKLGEADIKDVVMVVGYQKEFIKDHLGDGSEWGVKITYVEQEKRLGLAHAVKQAREAIGDEPFLVVLGDILFKMGFKEMVEEHEKSGADASVVLTEVEFPERFGIVEIKDDKIVGLEEKPEKPKTNLAIAGVYFFSSPETTFEIIDNLDPSWRGEYELTDTLKAIIDSGKEVNPIVMKGFWKDTGMPRDLLIANRLVLDEMKDGSDLPENVVASGEVIVGEDVDFIGEVMIKGPVVIGDGATIKDSVLGPYLSIADAVTVEDSVLKDSIILDNSHVRSAVFSKSVVGKFCQIGLGEESHILILGDHSRVNI